MGFFFVSYKHTDHVFVNELKRRLEAEDIDIWTDEKIKAGEEWKKAIDRWINSSVGVLVVVTPESLMSPYVTYEWSYALGLGDKNKPVIPLFLRQPEHGTTVEFTPNPNKASGIKIEIHPRLGDLQGYYFTDETRQEWDKLIRKLKEILSEGDLSDVLKNKEQELNDSHRAVWQATVDWLEKCDDPKAITVLGTAANKHNNKDVQKACALALCRRTKNTDPRAIPGLQLIVASGGWEHEASTTQALGDLAVADSEYAFEVLLSALSNNPQKSVSMREQAANQLGRVKDERALTALLNALHEEKTEPVINAIINGLGSQGFTEAIEPLNTLLSETQGYNQTFALRRVQLVRALTMLGNSGIAIVIEYAYTRAEQDSSIEPVVNSLAQVATQAIPMIISVSDQLTNQSQKQPGHVQSHGWAWG